MCLIVSCHNGTVVNLLAAVLNAVTADLDELLNFVLGNQSRDSFMTSSCRGTDCWQQ